MVSENLNVTAQIVVSHASKTELTLKELVDEIKCIYALVSSIDAEAVAEILSGKTLAVDVIKKPSIPLKDIVKAKYVVCLECGKKMRTLKTHLLKSHGLTPEDYFQRFGLDPKKFPLVCREYSVARSQMAKDRGLGGRNKKSSS